MKTIKYDKRSLVVYEHLEPIVDCLLEHGNQLSRDYRWGENRTGYFCLLVGPIDFELLEKEFSFPSYIRFDRNENSVQCNKTWAAIKGCVPRDYHA